MGTALMSQAFISYSRVDSAFVERFIKRLQQAFPNLTIWHDQSPHGLIGGDNWWDEILKGIADSDIFIYILSNESINSLYCQAEFTEARRLQKRIITIQARDKTELTDDLDDIQFIDMKNGPDDPEGLVRLTAAVNKQLSLAKKMRPLWKPVTSKPHKDPLPTRTADAPDVTTSVLTSPTAEQEALRLARSGLRWQIIGVIVALILGVAALVLPLLDRLSSGQTPTPIPTTAPAVNQVNTLSPLEIAGATQTQDALDFQRTLDASNAAQAVAQQLTATAFAPTQEAEMMATVNAILTTTREALFAEQTRNAAATLTAQPTNSPVPPTQTPTSSTITPLLPTQTPSLTPTLDPLQPLYVTATAYDYRQGNDAWTPITHDFDGVTMVLVPPGCFMMGSDEENPVHQQCFDEPFWIDQTEVTQGDFERLGGVKANSNRFDGDQRPVERISWLEARRFCKQRGARLPTEREWEYAARGPDDLVYPWGNEWNRDNVVVEDQTMPVGSIAVGASWVGALDMSGNVWEWTSSLYWDYPYDSTDGREDDANITDARVLRGGAIYPNDLYIDVRAPARRWNTPHFWNYFWGFRCARSS